ncbi:MAG: fatty acid desaturase [Bacteroidia bacterium]
MRSMSELIITDPVYTKKERLNFLDRTIMNFIREERDLPFVHLMIKMFLIIVPMAVIMFIPGMFRWWFAGIYLAINWALFMGRYILMLHCTSHRALFKKEHEGLNKIIPWFLGPFFGESPETYFGHHLGMHHPENNLKDDLSTTMPYQRDSFKDFMTYFLIFFIKGIPDITAYFSKKKRLKLRKRVVLGELSWFLMVILLSLFNWHATLIVFIIPLCFTRFMMMAGNWGQHAFIDAESPGNCYRNSLTCINSGYNKACFNDGYHIIHHIKPALHYTDMPVEFEANKATYAKEKAIVFQGIDFFVVWFFLMTKSYKSLAKRYVHLDDTYVGKEDELIAFFKVRTLKIPAEKMV